MVVIVITVIIQGPQVDPGARGEVKDLMFVNSGFFQAVGVISFGKSPRKSYYPDPGLTTTVAFVCRMISPLSVVRN